MAVGTPGTPGVSDAAARHDRHVLMVVPGKTGGIDSVIGYLLAAWPGLPGLPPVRRMHSRGASLAGSPLRLANLLLRLFVDGARRRVALVHVNMASRGSTLRKLLVAQTAVLVGVPYIVHLHGGGFRSFYAALPSLLRPPVAWLFRRAALVIVLGEVWRGWVADTFDLAPDRIKVLPNGVPDPRQAMAPRRDRQNQPPQLLFLGQLGPRKGVDDLLAALARPPLRDSDWRALLAGDGDVDRLRRQVQRLGLADRVAISGWLDPAATQAALADADLFVLPSYAEGLSVALLEAMAWELPVVATPVGAHGEVVEDGKTGLLVAPGDVAGLAQALAKLVADADERQRMGGAARQRFLERYEIGRVLRQLADCYADVLARGQA